MLEGTGAQMQQPQSTDTDGGSVLPAEGGTAWSSGVYIYLRIYRVVSILDVCCFHHMSHIW